MDGKLKALLALSLAANVLLAGFVAGRMTAPAGAGPTAGHERAFAGMPHFSHLGPEARRALRPVLLERRGAMRAASMRTREARAALNAALSETPLDRARVDALKAALVEADAARNALFVDLVVESLAALPDEDRAEAIRRMEEGRGRHRPRRGPPPPPGG